jgi:hypothetical protein
MKEDDVWHAAHMEEATKSFKILVRKSEWKGSQLYVLHVGERITTK